MDLNKRFKVDTKTIEMGAGDEEGAAHFIFKDPNSRHVVYELSKYLTPKEAKFLETNDFNVLETMSEVFDVEIKILKGLIVDWQNVSVGDKNLDYNKKNVDWLFSEFPNFGHELFTELFAADEVVQQDQEEVKKSSESD